MSIKSKQCRICKSTFDQFRSTQVVCSINCSIEYANKKRIAIERTQSLQERKITRERKEAMKPLTKMAKEAERMVNKYCRLRDFHDGCISCDKPSTWNGQWHASHYKSVGANSATRFNLWNIHKSCSQCNRHLSGAIESYTPKLIAKIGQEKFDILNNHERVRKYTPE